MSAVRRVRNAAFVLGACVLAGCSSSAGSTGPKPVGVKGTVKLDGKPIAGGSVLLLSETGACGSGDVQPD